MISETAEKRFYMVPGAIAYSFFDYKPRSSNPSVMVSDYNDYTKLIILGSNSKDNPPAKCLELLNMDTRLVRGADRNEFSEEELEKFSMMRRFFSYSQYTHMYYYDWYYSAYKCLLNAYETICFLMERGILNLDNKDWFKQFFNILDKFDFFEKLKTESTKHYEEAFRKEIELTNNALRYEELFKEKK